MKLLSLNSLGLALVVVGFAVSLGRVFAVSGIGTGEQGNQIIIAHWNLEPGYREAIQSVIDDYEALPHVRAAGLTVSQASITEKFYAQWLNTHLVAGTAPDISKRGKAQLTYDSNTARYFEPIGRYVAEPNPYNAPQYLPDGLDPRLAEFLATRPWRATFIEGMDGGYMETLNDYYAVPTSFNSGIKLYFNRQLMRAAKDVAIDALAQDPRPTWLAVAIDEGFVIPDTGLHAWLSGDEPPLSLGQLVLVCEASMVWAESVGRDNFMPIAGSSFTGWRFALSYQVPFTSPYGPAIDLNGDGALSPDENAAAVAMGVFSLRDERLRAFHACVHKLAGYFPPGYLALDRERANYRFVGGRAMIIASGAWDAQSLFNGAANPVGAEPFEIVIAGFPLPGPDEKWGGLITGKASEADRESGSRFQVCQKSKHKHAAIDFLRFLTSYTVNQRFNQEASWLPVIVGTRPDASIAAFAIDPAGTYPRMKADINVLGGYIGSRYRGLLNQYLTGDITYDAMVARIDEALEQERVGLNDAWFRAMTTQRDGNRNIERVIAASDVRNHLLGRDGRAENRAGLLTNSVRQNNGNRPRALWQRAHPDQPFPDR
ncbi:MAG: ABC transporter substrate-binding protein [Planctomycetota bacterium]